MCGVWELSFSPGTWPQGVSLLPCSTLSRGELAQWGVLKHDYVESSFFFPLSYNGDFLMVMHIFLSDINSFFDFSPPARLQISVNTGEKITLSGSW